MEQLTIIFAIREDGTSFPVESFASDPMLRNHPAFRELTKENAYLKFLHHRFTDEQACEAVQKVP